MLFETARRAIDFVDGLPLPAVKVVQGLREGAGLSLERQGFKGVGMRNINGQNVRAW